MILDDIVEKTKIRVSENKKIKSLEQMKQEAFQKEITKDFPFEKALKNEHMSYIMECKKASPSKGLIDPHFDYVEIAKTYETIGANALSVLTEPYFFKGSNEFLKEISDNVSLPILRKDFVVDEYMIYEAKTINASAVLLICSILDLDTLKRYIQIADELGLSALVEAHNEQEVQMALSANARIIGVNNRDLKTFTVDFNNSIRLRNMVSDDIIFVSESGVKTHDDILKLESHKVNAVLIGETMMRASDKQYEFDKLRGLI
jgi:indole-3-glycerol phosphate synthase